MSKYALSLLLLPAALIPGSCNPTVSVHGSPVPSKVSHQVPSGKEVTFTGVGGLTLKGTYLVPAGAAHCGALVLLPGSGPTDRNGNQTGLDVNVLKDIAEKLAANGMATLRFDKRAVSKTYADSFPKDKSQLGDFFSWDAFVGDAEAAYKFLKAQPEVDPEKVGVLGHSEGGLIALAMTKYTKPAALVLVSTAARNLGDVIVEQIGEGYSAQFQTPEGLRKNVAETKRIIKAIVDTHQVPTDVPKDFASLFPSYLAKYLYSVFTLEPTAAAAEYKGPVLIVQGEKDIQVSATKDAPKLLAAFDKGQAELYSVKDATHCLKKYIGPTDPGFQGPTDAGALDKIASWCKKNLG